MTGDKPDFNLKTVLYATDFSAASESAGFYAARLAAHFSATLLVAHAFTPTQAAMELETAQSRPSQQRKDLQAVLSRKAVHLECGSIDSVPTLLEGDPKEVIPGLADMQAPSLIVLGTHGGGRFERGIIGSIAEQILRSTLWPCLTVGPQVESNPTIKFPFDRILYATDFTPEAAHAAAFAEAFGARIDVLNVVQDEAVRHPDRLSELRQHFFDALDGLAPPQAKEFCDPLTFVEVGRAHDRILQHIKDSSIDLLVLGIRKPSHLGMEMRTSGAFRLIVDAECPVLTITQQGQPSRR